MEYTKNEDGNVAIMFSVSVFMLLILTGVGIDYTNVTRLQSELQAQVDGGVLAAATTDVSGANNKNKEDGIRREAALSLIGTNGFSDENLNPEFEINDSTVIMRAEVEYKPFFGRFLGRETMTLRAEAESGLGTLGKVDIVLVLDNTNSMRVEGKMDALKEGALSLVDAIEESNSESQIGLVPFSRYVRLNDSARTASWFQMPYEYDTPRTWDQATHTGGTCTEVTKTRDVDGVEETYTKTECTGQTTTYEERSTVIESRWKGCVGTRLPPYSERDDSYTHKIPGLLDIIPTEVSGLNRDEKPRCPREIVPLTDDYDKLKSEINRLKTTDNTYIPSGLIWGQRVLSPGEPFDNSPKAGDPETRQVMVLMTDGNNTTEIKLGSANAANLNAPPYIDSVHSNKVAYDANAATARMCQNVKEADIDVYTIAFKVTDPTTKSLLRNCASRPNQAFTAESNAALIQQFKKISGALAEEVRLMR